jgi:hypothetical protein
MPPTEISSDIDLHKNNREYLVGRWHLLSDLNREFATRATGYLFFAVVLIMIIGVAKYLEKLGSLSLIILASLTAFCLVISLHSYLWQRWFTKRRDLTHALFHNANHRRDTSFNSGEDMPLPGSGLKQETVDLLMLNESNNRVLRLELFGIKCLLYVILFMVASLTPSILPKEWWHISWWQ